MKSQETQLKEFEEILDQLIDNAERLLEASQKVISHEELESLQQKQESLLKSLVDKDSAFHQQRQEKESDLLASMRVRTNEKLSKFQELNDRFIENITAAQGVIKFDQVQIKKSKKAPKSK